jgi:hypothetical protein
MENNELIEHSKVSRQYWIQEQAPAGNYFDSVGLDPRTTEEQAFDCLRSYRKTFSERKFRLVRKTTDPLPY